MAIHVSMKTIPCRKERLMENLPSILEQTYQFTDLYICIDDDLSDEDKSWYQALKEIDDRIRILECEEKWRSCNKLLPALKLYPDDDIITIDDDITYPKDCLMQLVKEHERNPNCVIAHEVHPIIIQKNNIDGGGSVSYFNGFDIKLLQKEWGKGLSDCTLYPAHCFDGTDLFDYERMMYCTEGKHDELWFWVNHTLNEVRTIGLNYIYSFMYHARPFEEGEFRLSTTNSKQETIDRYMRKINECYPQLYYIITSNPTEFIVNQSNVYAYLALSEDIKRLYWYGFKISRDDTVTDGWWQLILNKYNGNGQE